MMVGFGPSASAFTIDSIPGLHIASFVNYHLNGRSFFSDNYGVNDESFPLSSRVEFKVASQHNPQAYGFYVDFSGESLAFLQNKHSVQLLGLVPSYFLDSDSSAYSWRTVSSPSLWGSGAVSTNPIYYQWVPVTVSVPDFSSPGVLWDGGPIPAPYGYLPPSFLQGGLRLFVYSFALGSGSGWYGVSSAPFASVKFVPSELYFSSSIYSALSNGTNPALNAILTSVNAIKDSATQQSPMDKFESDYLNNFQNQVEKTEDYLGSSSPVLPNNFVSSSGGGLSVVDSLTDGFGLSSDSFSESDFDSAVSQIGGVSSVNEGGPWYFFTEGVMSGMETGSPSTAFGDDWLEVWVSDSERRYRLWATP